MAKTKFDLRKIAGQLIPFQSKEEAVEKIKNKVSELKMSDSEILEFIKQANVASQYDAYKNKGYKLNTDIDAITVVPSKVFEEITKVNLKKSASKKPSFFSNLKNVVSSSYSMKKKASLEVFKPVQNTDISSSLIELIKLSGINDRALKAVKDIELFAVNDLKSKKGEFISLSKKFEETIRRFPSLKSKYANLLDDRGSMGNSYLIPSAGDIVEVKKLQEKIANIVVEISKLSNVLDIIKRSV